MQKAMPDPSTESVFHPEGDTYQHFEDAEHHPFQARPDGVPRVNVWWLAEVALLSYWAPPRALEVFEGVGLAAEYVEGRSTNCYVAHSHDAVIVGFRGTQPDQWQDILADLKIIPVEWSVGGARRGRVHRGFKDALDEVWAELESLLNGLASGRTVWFCGHSLGAALATLAAHRYADTRGVCTFGSPRVGDGTFAREFDRRFPDNALRYVNNHDIVTHVPPPPGYKHVETRRFIGQDGRVSGAQPRFSHFFPDLVGAPKQLLGLVSGFAQGTLKLAPAFLLDHMPKAYAIGVWNDYHANG